MQFDTQLRAQGKSDMALHAAQRCRIHEMR